MTKTAIILFNLGGPNSLAAVKPFLFNLFNDPAILRLPTPWRTFLAWLIATRREKTAQAIYQKIGGRSPILENTQAQANALEKALRVTGTVKCFVAMRYWHPRSDAVLQEVKNFAPDNLVYLPLYPQYSTTTTASSLKDFDSQLKTQSWAQKIKTKTLCCYPTEPGFISTLAQSTRAAYDAASAYGKPRVLFSAHGLPEKIVKAGDPYQGHCERTAKALVASLAIEGLDWVLCYQSRVGPLEWIKPAIEDEVRRAGADKVPLVVVPIAFVSEHSETLVELDIEYRERAKILGVPNYQYVPTVSTSANFIAGLAALVEKALNDPRGCISGEGSRICPKAASGCCQQ